MQKFILIILLLILPFKLNSQLYKLNLKRQYPVLQAENKIWIGTPQGLYQFSPDDNSFQHFMLPMEPAIREIKELYYHDEWLWCILDSGLAALHLRLNEWLFFDTSKGLPSNQINSMDFQSDYAWVATPGGAARYDLLIEEWEFYDKLREITGRSVHDLKVVNEDIWLITEEGFSEFDPDFEKWRHYKVAADTNDFLKRIFLVTNEIWFVTAQGLVRFDPQLQTQQSFILPPFHQDQLWEIFVEDSRIWAFTKLGIYFYEQQSGVWREFEGNSYLKSSRILDGFINAQQIWILTDQNVLLWDRMRKSWEILDYASGLSTTMYQSVYSVGGLDFLITPSFIDYRRSAQEAWRIHKIESLEGVAAADKKNIFKSLFDNESGGYVPLGNYNWSWQGTRITWITDYQQMYDDDFQSSDPIINYGKRIDLKNQLMLSEFQSVTGFYNNIDYSETMYGLRYRSREKGILREMSWGDFRRESGDIPFAESANVFGLNFWFQAGEKTTRFKRSRFSLKAQAGEVRTKKTYEYLEGGINDQLHIILRDIDYVKNQFYAIPDLTPNTVPNKIEIYVDDLNSTNNTTNTLSHSIIAGVRGDFDLLKATEDYYFYDKAGVIRFTSLLNPDWTIVIRYSSSSGIHEALLQYGGSVTTTLENFYYLGGKSIIPYSFSLTIKDSTGISIPLYYFQIDNNHDGQVDSEWIDFENGILFFPVTTPFPPDVYDTSQPSSIYTLQAYYQSELELIQLQHQNLVRGSEKLYLDGIIALGGNDYVIDYSNGTLVFVREGIVNKDTRIEIEYEYYLTADHDQIRSSMLNWSPSDNFYLQGDWLQFHEELNNAGTLETRSNLLTLHSELRNKIGSFDIRIIPALAYMAENDQLSAINLETLISSSNLRFQSIYQNYSETYSNLYLKQSVIGAIKSNLQFFTSLDIRDDLRLSGEWREIQGYTFPQATTPTDNSTNISLLFHRQNWPGWQLGYQLFKTRASNMYSDKNFFYSRWEYQLPHTLSKKILLQGVKLEAFFRIGDQKNFSNGDNFKQRFQNGYIRLNTNFTDQFQASIFYRRNDLKDNQEQNLYAPISRSERLLIDLSHEQWRLLQVNFRAEHVLNQNFHKNSALNTINMRHFSQINFRLSPGQIWAVLSPLFFEFNINQSISGWQTHKGNASSWLWRLFSSKDSYIQDGQISNNYFVKNEIRLGSYWLIYSLIEWNEYDNRIGASSLKNYNWLWNEKVDIKLGFKTRLNIQYRQFYQNRGYQRTNRYWEPSLYVEHRWSPDFQNIINILYRQRRNVDYLIQDVLHNWESRYEIIWKLYKFLGIKRLEIRQSFTGAYRYGTGYANERNYQLGLSSAIDLYPLHSMILRLRFDVNQYIDEIIKVYNFTSFMFNLKLSFRF